MRPMRHEQLASGTAARPAACPGFKAGVVRKAAQGATSTYARIGGRAGLRIVSPQVGRKLGATPGSTAVPLVAGGAGDIVLIVETEPATDSGTIGRATMTGR